MNGFTALLVEKIASNLEKRPAICWRRSVFLARHIVQGVQN
jgi:hypothetical protein